MPETYWKVAITVPEKAITEPVGRISNQIMLSLLVLISFVLFLAGLMLHRHLIRPLRTITGQLKKIEKDSKETISSMQAGQHMLEEGTGVINLALSSLDEITNGISTISTAVTNLNEKASGLATEGEEVRQKLDVVVESSRENLSKTEAVGEKAGETGSSMESLSESTEELMGVVKKLASA